MRPWVAFCVFRCCCLPVAFVGTDALEMGSPLGRRDALQAVGAAISVAVDGSDAPVMTVVPSYENDNSDLRETFQSFTSSNKKQQQQQQQSTVNWSPTSRDFSELRYSTSSLSSKESNVPASSCSTLPRVPSWMEGHWLCTYKFDGVSFPKGRRELSLTVPGAGLGTCVMLPNVGYNPSPFVQRFGAGDGSSFFGYDNDEDDDGVVAKAAATSEPFVVEDVAYNLPRRFEGFWPQAKVTSVRVSTDAATTTTTLSPSCLVTGEGCSFRENPLLHGRYATRCHMEFQGPTRKGGLRSQQIDLTMVDSETTSATTTTNNNNNNGGGTDKNNDEFIMSRSFVQYNVQQELTCYYREFVSYDRQQQQKLPNGRRKGRTVVAAFLPSSPEAVALYSYTMKYYSITGDEAKMY